MALLALPRASGPKGSRAAMSRETGDLRKNLPSTPEYTRARVRAPQSAMIPLRGTSLTRPSGTLSQRERELAEDHRFSGKAKRGCNLQRAAENAAGS